MSRRAFVATTALPPVLGLLAVLSLGLPPLAWATGAPVQRVAAAPGQPVLPPCMCRAEGREFDIGATICLQTPEGRRIATCEMDQNVTTWRPTPRRCPGEATS